MELWLPWCTASALDPLFRMEDAYGCMGIDNIVGTAESGVASAPRLDDSRYAQTGPRAAARGSDILSG